jgi:hypothetical protein
MQSMYATFESSLPYDGQEIGNQFIQPGKNVTIRLQEGLKKLGRPATEVWDEESYGWGFLVGPLGFFKMKPAIYCLIQGGRGSKEWLLITEQFRGCFVFSDDAFYRQILEQLVGIISSESAFTNLTPWITAKQYEETERKIAAEVLRQRGESR